MTNRATLLLVVGACALTACGADPESVGVSRGAIVTGDETSYLAGLSDEQAAGTVEFANDAATTFELLDVACGLHSDAARQLVKHRDGRDRQYPSADDDTFDDMNEIANVSEVGVWNLGQLVDCATARGFVAVPSSVTVWDYAQLDSELQAVVDDLIANAITCYFDPADPWSCNTNPFRFGEATITSVGGTPVEYFIRLYRIIDPEGGIVETYDYTLNADFEVIDFYPDAG